MEIIYQFQKSQSSIEREEAFNLIYEEFKDVVYRRAVAYTQSKDDGYDVAQNIWIKIYKGLMSYKGDAKLSTWIFRIVSNECINFLKAKDAFYSFDFEEFDESNIPSYEDNIYGDDVTKLLDSLSKDMKVLMILKHIEGYSYREIALQTGLGESAIKMRLKRAKEMLKNTFQDQYET